MVSLKINHFYNDLFRFFIGVFENVSALKSKTLTCWALLVCRWEPSLRMTPDQALKHAWIHEARNLKPQLRPQILRKPNLCFPSETRKDKVQGYHLVGKKGTALPIASPFLIVRGGLGGTSLEDCTSVSLNSTVDHNCGYTITGVPFLTFGIFVFQENCL